MCACVCAYMRMHVCVHAHCVCGHVLDKKESWVFTSAALVVVRTAVYLTSYTDYLTSYTDYLTNFCNRFCHLTLTAVTDSDRFEKCPAQSLSH